MIRSNLCDCSDVYIHVKGTIEVRNTGTAAGPNNRNKKVTFENYPHDAHDADVVMPMCNFTEYSDTYSKTW